MLAGYAYKRPVRIDNSGNPAALEGDQIKLWLISNSYAGAMPSDWWATVHQSVARIDFARLKSDFSDLRFTLENDTLLNYWVESLNYAAGIASVWVKVSGVSASTQGTILMQYSNASATAVSSYDATMELVTPAAYTLQNGATLGTHPRSATSPCFNLTAEGHAVTFAGQLASYPAGGWGFLFEWIPDQTYTAGNTGNARLFTHFNTATDYIDCYVSNTTGEITLSVYRNGQAMRTLVSRTNLYGGDNYTTWTAGKSYKIAVSGNPKNIHLYVWRENRLSTNESWRDRWTMTPPNSGSLQAFTLGAYNSGTFTNTLKGRYCNVQFLNFQPTWAHLEAIWENRKYYGKDEGSKWVKNFAPLIGGNGQTVNAVAESTLLPSPDGTKLRMWYAQGFGGIADPNTGQLGPHVYYRETTDPNLATWSNIKPVVGGGNGSEPNVSNRPCMIYYPESPGQGPYYLYYIKDVASGGPIYMQESTNGETFSGPVYTVLAGNEGGFAGFANVGVYPQSPTVWWMYAEVYFPEAQYRYANAVFRSTTGPRGPFVSVPGYVNPLATMRLNGCTSNNATVKKLDGVLNVWQHACNKVNFPSRMGGHDLGSANLIIPSELYRMTTADHNNHVFKYNGEPIVRMEFENEIDQTGADPDITEWNGKCYMVYDNCNNATSGVYNVFWSLLAFARFEGTREQLVNDLTITAEAEQPASYQAAELLIQAGQLLSQAGQLLRVG